MLDVAKSALTRITFIKKNAKEIYVRELAYVPGYKYLQQKNWDISDVSVQKSTNDFTGRLYIKKWGGEKLSVHQLQKGNIVSSGKVYPKTYLPQFQKNNSQSLMTCTWDLVPGMEIVCDMVQIRGDVPINLGNCEAVPSGDYMLEVYCIHASSKHRGFLTSSGSCY